MIRSMLAAFSEEPELFGLSDQYMFGKAILVKPVTRPLSEGGGETSITLPQGGWYDWFCGEYLQGGQIARVRTPLDRFPLFVRAGSILPLVKAAENTDMLPFMADEIVVYGGADGTFELYDDSGDGMDYLNGEYLRIPLRYSETERTLYFGEAEGSMPADCSFSVRLILPDGTEKSSDIHYSGKEMQVAF